MWRAGALQIGNVLGSESLQAFLSVEQRPRTGRQTQVGVRRWSALEHRTRFADDEPACVLFMRLALHLVVQVGDAAVVRNQRDRAHAAAHDVGSNQFVNL